MMGNARDDESEGENRRGRRQTQTKHVWDDVSEGDDRYRAQMEDDDDNDSQARAGGDITRYGVPRRTNQLLVTRPTRPQVRFFHN